MDVRSTGIRASTECRRQGVEGEGRQRGGTHEYAKSRVSKSETGLLNVQYKKMISLAAICEGSQFCNSNTKVQQ